MSWARAIRGLNRVVVRALGEDVVLQTARDSIRLRGVLTDPERLGRLAGADFVMAEAMLTLRSVDAPSWLARGTSVLSSSGASYDVVRAVDNGEGLLEVTLCRSV